MAKADDEKLLRRFRILLAPLDWGLGHATRCIPLIKELMANRCEVWLAGERLQEALLRSEFPELTFLPLAGYRIEYSKTNQGLLWKILTQMPKLVSAVRREHKWLEKMIASHKFDAVISDNRYGLYHSTIPSVFITHQLNIKTGLGTWNERIIQRWNYNHINRFTECWIPDVAGENNLAGELSHPLRKPSVTTKYIGLLSRFQTDSENFASQPKEMNGGHLLFILSGPEPQRSILENRIVDEISHYNGTGVIVRGLPSSLSVIPSTGMIKFYNHLPATELGEEIKRADWVISRSGYSTVMDVVKLGKKSILIPTPGQREQEYLARHLEERQIAFTVAQKHFSLRDVLDKAQRFPYRTAKVPSHLTEVVQTFLAILSRENSLTTSINTKSVG